MRNPRAFYAALFLLALAAYGGSRLAGDRSFMAGAHRGQATVVSTLTGFRGMGDAKLQLEGADAGLGVQRLDNLFLFAPPSGSQVQVMVNAAAVSQPVRLGDWHDMGANAVVTCLTLGMGLFGIVAAFRDPPASQRRQLPPGGQATRNW